VRDQRGFALVVTLLVTALLVALVVEFITDVYVDTSSRRNFVDGQQNPGSPAPSACCS